MQPPVYIKNLLKPNGQKASGKRVWSIDLETVWLPFFTATNTEGLTTVPNDVLGAPLRLGYEQDGTVKFSKNGKPVVKLAKDLAESVKLVRENFVAGLQQYASTVQDKSGEEYTAQAKLNIEAGQPIMERDSIAQQRAMAEQMENAVAIAERIGATVPTAEAVPELVPA